MISTTKRDIIQTTKLFCELLRIENTNSLIDSIFAHRSSKIFYVKLVSDISAWYFSFIFNCLETGELNKDILYYTFKFKQLNPAKTFIIFLNVNRVLICTEDEAKDLFIYKEETPIIEEDEAEQFRKKFYKV